MALIALLALAARALHLLALHGDVLFSVAVGDGPAYLARARAVAQGDWIGEGVFEQAPLYPYSLGMAMAFGAESLAQLRMLQACVGAASCSMLAAAAARMFADRRVGHRTGVVLALYAPAIHYESLIDKPVLTSFLLALFVLAAARLQDDRRLLDVLWASLALGGLALTRENLLLLLPAAALWIALGQRALPAARRAAWIAWLALGPAAALGLAAAHNQAAAGQAVVGRAQLGPNLWIGNHAGADGLYAPLRPWRGSFRHERADARAIAEERAGRPLAEAEVSGYWAREAARWVAGHPWQALALYARKLRWLASDREWMDAASYAVFRERSLVLRILGSLLRFGVLLPVAALGMTLVKLPRDRRWLPYGLPAVTLASLLPFFVMGRFRLPLAIELVPFAAVALASVSRAGGAPRRVAPRAAVLLLAAVAAWLPVGQRERPHSDTWVEIGTVLLEGGRHEDALAAFAKACAADPGNAIAHWDLALAQLEVGDLELARASLERAATLEPDWRHEARLAMGRGLVARGSEADHAELRALLDRTWDDRSPSADVWVEIGRLERLWGDPRSAEAAYRHALSLVPRHADAHNNLGWLLAKEGREEEAARHYVQALATDPGHLRAIINLGHLRAEATDLGLRSGAEALRLAERAERLLGAESPDAAELRAAAERAIARGD